MAHISLTNRLACLFIVLSFSIALYAQPTVGLIDIQPGVSDGYTLLRSLQSTSTYLVDNCGQLIHEWESTYTPGNSEYLLENGFLVRTAKSQGVVNAAIPGRGGGERVQVVDWNGNLLWEYIYNSPTYRMHHDVEVLPNGNILILAWEVRDYQECIDAGRDPSILPDSLLWPEEIIEVNPFTNQIVWEWELWDHLIQDYDSTKQNYGVVGDHPERFDVNFTGIDGPGADWIHANSIDYNASLDQIVVNSRSWSEFFVIDHSTTTAEAAGHTGGNSGKGGDILYRWGNPQTYDQGTPADQELFGAHDVVWIDEGFPDANKFLAFNNGLGRPAGPYSSVEVIDPPVDTATGWYAYTAGTAFGPSVQDWIYTSSNPNDFYSFFISGSQRLENGNTLICEGSKGKIFEIDTAGNKVWEYINPVGSTGPLSQGDTVPVQGFQINATFRATRYPADYPGLAGKDLTPGPPLEFNYDYPYICNGDTFTTCPPPVNLITSGVSSNGASLAWDAVPGAVGYEVTGAETGLAALSPFSVGNITNLTVGGLSPGTGYFWRVRAICDTSGETFSPYSDNVYFTTIPLCGAVTGLGETNITPTSVTLNWTAVVGASGYQIAGNAIGGTIVTLNISDSLQTSLQVNNLVPGLTYQWTIRSYCTGSGFSSLAVPSVFTTPASAQEKLTSGSEVSNAVRIYPNPANQCFYLSVPNAMDGEMTIKLFTIDGSLVESRSWRTGQPTIRFDVEGLPSGIYIVNASNALVNETRVLVVDP